MSRAERRRLDRQRRAGLARFGEHAAGAMTASLIRAPQAVGLFFAVDFEAQIFRQAVAGFVGSMEHGRHQCAMCYRTFGLTLVPVDWLLVLPCLDAAEALIAGICGGCSDRYPSDEALFEAAAGGLRALWPGLRRVEPAHMHAHGGRA